MKSFLINNYYEGISPRGVIAHVANLAELMVDDGIRVKVFKCPVWLRWFPRHGYLFHFFEQFVVPLIGMRYDKVIYPYNSASIFSVFHRGSILVVHDFIQNRPKIDGFNKISARLVRWTQWVYRKSARDVVYITDEVQRQARIIDAFPRARTFVIPNCFYQFRRRALPRLGMPENDRYVLLCSGRVPTKDLAGAIELFAKSTAAKSYKLKILGLGGDKQTVDSIAQSFALAQDRYLVLPYVSDDELTDLYSGASFVWVHSLREGFGRNLTEALICGRRVVASRIIPFVRQARDTHGIYLYGNRSAIEFESAFASCERDGTIQSSLASAESRIRDSLQKIQE